MPVESFLPAGGELTTGRRGLPGEGQKKHESARFVSDPDHRNLYDNFFGGAIALRLRAGCV